MPDEHLKFALNSAVDTLPHNANLHLCRKHHSSACPLCGEKQTLIHILNTCRVAREERRFNPLHNTILSLIVDLLSANTSSTAQLSSDLGSYAFPQHVVATHLCPDIVWWDNIAKKIFLIELTVCFESSFKHAAERKTTKYLDVLARARSSGYRGQVITLEIGSWGIIDDSGFSCLKKEFQIKARDCPSY